MRTICIVTGTRAEYSLLRPLIQQVQNSGQLQLQLVVTGMHLSPEFGMTASSVENDGFKIDRRIEMLLSSDTPSAIGKSTGLGLIGFADAFVDLKPDLLVVLGDRFEILSAVIAALYTRLPVAHIHGGETTAGAFDEGIRHAITKMSHVHFVAADEYRRRVVQLGEHPERVYNVGGLGVDAIQQMPLLSLSQIQERLSFSLNNKTLLITFHPVTLEDSTAEHQVLELLSALEQLDDGFRFIFTLPNADTDGRKIILLIEDFVAANPNSLAQSSLGQPAYWSVLQHAAAVVGNSSSGLLEAPYFKTPTVNIGERQAGRLMASSVLNCQPQSDQILDAITKATSDEFQQQCQITVNPYGDGGATEKILEVLRTITLEESLVKKQFFDIVPMQSTETESGLK